MSKNSASQRDQQRLHWMAETLCEKDQVTGLTRLFTRLSLAAATTVKLPYKVNCTLDDVTQLWPRLEAAVIARGMYVCRPVYGFDYRIWASDEDHAAMMTAIRRHTDVYNRIIRDLYNGATLDHMADHGSKTEFRIEATLARSNDKTFAYAFEQGKAQLAAAEQVAIKQMTADYMKRFNAGLTVD
jgi:hypothetical protein